MGVRKRASVTAYVCVLQIGRGAFGILFGIVIVDVRAYVHVWQKRGLLWMCATETISVCLSQKERKVSSLRIPVWHLQVSLEKHKHIFGRWECDSSRLRWEGRNCVCVGACDAVSKYCLSLTWRAAREPWLTLSSGDLGIYWFQSLAFVFPLPHK